MGGDARVINDAVSIRAPAWGATYEAYKVGLDLDGFNPRSRVGSDFDKAVRIFRYRWFQSALPRGERLPPGVRFEADKYRFNPRSRVGSDFGAAACRRNNTQFQSALPRGERRLGSCLDNVRQGFNPRSRVGSDEAGNGRSCD